MTSEIRTNSLKSRAGLSTVTMTDSGPIISGVTTANNFKSGISNLHSLGLTLTGGQLDVGSNIKIGNAGVITATSYRGDGSQLTGLSGVSVANQADNRLITATGTTDALNAEANLTWNAQTFEAYNASGPSYIAAKSNTNSGDYGIVQVQSGSTVRGRLVSDASVDAFRLDTAGRASAPITFHTGSSYTEKVRITSGGDLLIGTTTAAISAGKGLMIADAAGARIKLCDSDQGVTASDGFEIIQSNGGNAFIYNRENSPIIFGTNNTERMRITHEGSVGIGTDGSTYELEVHDGTGAAALRMKDGANNVICDLIANSTGGILRTTYNHPLVFTTNQVERVRINTHGFVKMMGDMSSHMSADGNNYHEMQADNPHIQILNMKHGSSNGYGIMMQFNHGKSTHWAFRVYNYASGSTNAFIRTDGDLENINNSYGGTSDVKLKENIVDASSQWDDIKALRVRNFNYKSDESKTKMLGLVAQEAEQVCPSLVKDQPDLGEENEDLGTTTKFMKYSIVYMKAIKALQEAQERIEKLEQENIALRVRVTNLEGN